MSENVSVISVDVRGEAFKAFTALFEKFQKEVGELPGAWGNVDKSIKKTPPAFTNINNILKDSAGLAKKIVKAYAPEGFVKIHAIVKETGKEFKNAQRTVDKILIASKGTAKVFAQITRSSFSLAKNIKDITLNIGKWAALGLFSLAAGGFGMKELGESASRKRSEAQGLGITPGEHESAKINLSRFTDVDAMLARLQDVRTDAKKQWALTSVGVTQKELNQNTAGLMASLLPMIRDKIAQREKATGQKIGENNTTKQWMESSGLNLIVGSLSDLVRIGQFKSKEIEKQTKQTLIDNKRLNLTDRTLSAWQDFMGQLERAGKMIENIFITKLTALHAPIDKLSQSFVNATKKILGGETGKKVIGMVGKGIDAFANFIKSFADGKYDEGIKKFISSIETLADMMMGLASVISFIRGDVDKKDGGFVTYAKTHSLGDLGRDIGGAFFEANNPKSSRSFASDMQGGKVKAFFKAFIDNFKNNTAGKSAPHDEGEAALISPPPKTSRFVEAASKTIAPSKDGKEKASEAALISHPKKTSEFVNTASKTSVPSKDKKNTVSEVYPIANYKKPSKFVETVSKTVVPSKDKKDKPDSAKKDFLSNSYMPNKDTVTPAVNAITDRAKNITQEGNITTNNNSTSIVNNVNKGNPQPSSISVMTHIFNATGSNVYQTVNAGAH